MSSFNDDSFPVLGAKKGNEVTGKGSSWAGKLNSGTTGSSNNNSSGSAGGESGGKSAEASSPTVETTAADLAVGIASAPSSIRDLDPVLLDDLVLISGGELSESRPKTAQRQREHMTMIQSKNRPKGGTLLIGDSLTERIFSVGSHRVRDLSSRNVFIAGAGGDNIQNACWRVNQGIVKAVGPEHVIVFIGTNNIGSTILDDFRPLFINLLRSIRRDAGPLCRISCIGVCGRSDLPGAMHIEYVESVNVIKRQVCEQLGVEYFPPFIEFFDRALFQDHIHFSARGFDVMVDFIISILGSHVTSDSGRPDYNSGGAGGGSSGYHRGNNNSNNNSNSRYNNRDGNSERGRSSGICINFQRGRCDRGNSCRFTH